MELRVVVRYIPRLWRQPIKVLVVQKKIDVADFIGGWVTHSMQWVDCNDDDLQDVVLDLFYKQKEK